MVLVKSLLIINLLLISSLSLGKSGDFGLGVRAGMHVFPVPGAGLDFFYNGDSYTLGVTFATGSLDFKAALEEEETEDSPAELDAADVDATLALFEGRYFFLWGLNISGGIGMRTINLDLSSSEPSTNSKLSTYVETQSIVTNFGLGIMGRWDSFYINFDLFAVTTANSGSAKVTSTFTGPGAQSADLSTLNDDLIEIAEKLGETSSVQMFNLGFGLFSLFTL